MKYLFIIVFFPLFSFGQNVYTLNDIENTMYGILSKTNKKPLSGEIHLYYPTGELHEIIPIQNGFQHGVGKMYYKSGDLHKITPFKNNKFDGFYQEYYKNGELKTSGKYIRGLEEGLWKSYYEDGRIKSEFNGFENGIQNGVMKWYYSWGEKQVVYKNDERISDYKCFDHRGKQISCK